MRTRLAEGRPVSALLESWEALESAAVREPEALTEVLNEAARLGVSEAFAVVAPAAAFGAAVVGAGGEVFHADETFRAWFGSPADSAACRRLVKLAARGGQASGLVEALDGAVLAASAGTAATSSGWPLPQGARDSLARSPRRIVLLGFAPSRTSDLAARASEAFGLTPLEARVAEAMLDAPDIQAAAERIGVGRETAREALAKAMRKAGAKRSPDLVRRMMDLMCGDHPAPLDLAEVLALVFGATPAEARTAAKFAEGLTAREVAQALGVKEGTVRGQVKAVFAKTGVGKAKDLVRIAAEAGTLASIAAAAETAPEPGGVAGRLRVAPAADGRRVAFWDYGPHSGRVLFVTHGTITGRTLPPALVRELQARGWRPVVPQRPGFGLTDAAKDGYLAAGADDMAVILDALRAGEARLLVRDDGAAVGLEFARRHPRRVDEGVLVNPRLPGRRVRSPQTRMGAVTRAFLVRPEIIGVFAEMMRRQTRTDLMRDIVRQSASHVPADIEALSRPGVLDAIVRDIQAMAARSSRGFAQEQALYATDWTPPESAGGSRWTVAECRPLLLPGAERAFGGLPNVRFTEIEGAGLLSYLSHPQAVAALLDPH